MRIFGHRNNGYVKYRNITIAGGVVVNVLLAYLMHRLQLPLYLDAIGTIAAGSICGFFPGILVAVLTNFFCSFFAPYSLYYMLIGVLMALVSSLYARDKDRKKSIWKVFSFVIVLALIGGVLGTLFQWILLGDNQFDDVVDAATSFSNNANIPYFLASVLINIGLNFVDKGICSFVVGAVAYFIPREYVIGIWNSGWKQRPLSNEEIADNKKHVQSGRNSILIKTVGMLIVAAVLITLVMGWIGVSQYYQAEKNECRLSAESTAHYTAMLLDGEQVKEFLKKGENAKGYAETREKLYEIRDNSAHVKYLYIISVQQDGGHYIMDLETEDMPAYAPGEVAPIDEPFYPYLETLLEGGEIPPVEATTDTGWLLTVYEPIRDENGECVAYVGADVAMSSITGFAISYLTKVAMIFSGFLILIISFALWFTKSHLIQPVNSMVAWADGFMKHSGNQEEMDKEVKKLRDIDIYTGDEVEQLYNSLCKMAADTTNQLRDINYFADATAKMQNGLIVTMADMVENRDSDTGAHVQKTAAYVKIIAESLLNNGYYVEKLTPKYMSDIVMSAPLHDVGKINISDTVLNKPGKLTDEEYEIMKMHTTYGKEILEKAIATVEGENYLKEARNMAAYHHERWDGKGYPEGLRGEVIPLSARIMAVADVFDALTSPRVYKPAFPLEKALMIMEEGSGTQFDPKCVNAFLDALPEVKQVLKKYQGM